ncbi:MAG: DOMON-like domain-containing protein [Thiobacillaceae bacterium]
MIEQALAPHPTTPAAWVESLTVRLARRAGALEIEFRLLGDLTRLSLPTGATGRRDGLWQHTCCEVFIGSATTPAYREWNLAPSGAWQAYDFTAYRTGRRPAEVEPPGISLDRSPLGLTLTARLPLAETQYADIRLGVCAVLEDSDGAHSFWAASHPGKQPDFHHPASFTLTLDPTP